MVNSHDSGVIPMAKRYKWEDDLLTIIRAIRIKPMQYTELGKKTALLGRTMFDTYVEFLEEAGLIEKNEQSLKYRWKDDFKYTMSPDVYLHHTKHLVENFHESEKLPPAESSSEIYQQAVDLFRFIDSFSRWFETERIEKHIGDSRKIRDYGCFPNEEQRKENESFLRLLSQDLHTVSLLEHLMNDSTFRKHFMEICETIRSLQKNLTVYRNDFNTFEQVVDISSFSDFERGAGRELFHLLTLTILNESFTDEPLKRRIQDSIDFHNPSFEELVGFIGIPFDQAVSIFNYVTQETQKMFGPDFTSLSSCYKGIHAFVRRMESLFARLELGIPLPGECQLCLEERSREPPAD